MMASEQGYVEIVKYLLEQEEIDFNAVDDKARTAIMRTKTAEIEQLFLSGYGVIGKNDVLDVTGFKKVELIQAAFHGNLKKVQSLLESGMPKINNKSQRE